VREFRNLILSLKFKVMKKGEGIVHDHDMATDARVLSAVTVDKDAARKDGDLALILFAAVVVVSQGVVQLNRTRELKLELRQDEAGVSLSE
jgi:hypothetical protein